MRVENLMIGLVILVFCLGLSIATPDVFSLSAGVEDLIQIGFGVLGLFSFIIATVLR